MYWLAVYLFALPIWNFVLPAYAFWHFDDFSWGETRKVDGEKKGEDHGDSDGKKSDDVELRLWCEWETERLLKNKLTVNMERKSSDISIASTAVLRKSPTKRSIE